MYLPNQHPPWPLHRARVLHIDESLVQAVGLPRSMANAGVSDTSEAAAATGSSGIIENVGVVEPTGIGAPASVLYSPGVPARFGIPERLARKRRTPIRRRTRQRNNSDGPALLLKEQRLAIAVVCGAQPNDFPPREPAKIRGNGLLTHYQ
jgi:hypothetical protein